MEALRNFHADVLVQALCRTLLHSLWQGVILAAVAGLIMLSTRQQRAATRYHLLVGSLALFMVGALITFGVQLFAVQSSPDGINAALTAGAAPGVVITGHASTNAGNYLSQELLFYINTHATQVVMIWLLLISIKSIRMLTGLYDVHMLRTQKVTTPDASWRQRLLQLAAQLGISCTVTLLESALAKAPMVVGHLKPVILVPVGLLTSLTPEAIEAILIHELAHIQRRDYLVNLLQCLVEIIFFFNPAVSWISSLIKAERENCCDDIVMHHTSSKKIYIQALVSCEEFHSPAYAMGLPGSRNTLLARVKRMANNNNHSLNVVEKTLLSVCLVSAGICMVAFSGHANKVQAQSKKRQHTTVTTHTTSFGSLVLWSDTTYSTHTDSTALCTDTAGQRADTMPANLNDTLQGLHRLNGKLKPVTPLASHLAPLPVCKPSNDSIQPAYTTIYKPYPASTYPKTYAASYSPTAPTAPMKPMAPLAPMKPMAPATPLTPMAPMPPAAPTDPMKPMAPIGPMPAPSVSPKPAVNAKPAASATPATQASPATAARPATQASPAAAAKPATAATPAKPATTVTTTTTTTTTINNNTSVGVSAPVNTNITVKRDPQIKTVPRETIHLVTPGSLTPEQGEDLTKRVTTDLLKAGLIANTDHLSYKLNRKEFIVNDKPLPAGIVKQFSDKYVPTDGWSLVYNFTIDSQVSGKH